MSLWYESLVGRLSSIDGYYGVNPNAKPSVQRKQAACIVRYLAMPVPRQMWERAIRDESAPDDFFDILHKSYIELQNLPLLAGTIDHALLVALAFIDDLQQPGHRPGKLSLEEYLLAAEKVLAQRPDLRRLGGTINQWAHQAAGDNEPPEPLYGLFRFGNRMYYADTFGAYVFQVEPSPAAWEKAGRGEKWKRTRKLPLELQHLALGRLHKDPILEMKLPNCHLLRWKRANTQFLYEPDWNDSVPLEDWKKLNEITPILLAHSNETRSDTAGRDSAMTQDWISLLNGFFDSVPAPLLARLRRFPAGSWELLEAAYQWDKFEDLMDANPALAVCLALRVRVGKQPGVRRQPLNYGSLVRCPQREIAAGIGFGDSEAVANILKKVVPDACTPRELSFLSDLIHDPLIMTHLKNAHQISGPAIFLLQDDRLRGKLGGGFITDISRQYPLSEDICSQAEGVKRLRGGTKHREFTHLNSEMLDLARFNPDVVIHSIEDFKAKQSAMIKKLNEGTISKRTVQFPEPPFAGTEYIQPIITANELALEGKEMRHCIKSYVRDIFKGLVAVYRVTFPERATLSLERGPSCWRLGQLKCENNEEPGGETSALVYEWLKANGVRTGAMRKRARNRELIVSNQTVHEAHPREASCRPEPGKWAEGSVDVRREHFEIFYGDEGGCIALVGRDERDEKGFVVQFLLDSLHPEAIEKAERGLRLQLDFYLVKKPERDRWTYMIYHCGTLSNAYSHYHWGYFPVVGSSNNEDQPVKNK